MGLWDEFVVVRDEGGLNRPELKILMRYSGWTYCRLTHKASGVEGLVEDIGGVKPCIGAWIADSDSAAIVAAGPGIETAWLAVNEDYEGDDYAETTKQWRSPDLQAEAVRALAAWSAAFAPARVSADTILGVLRDEELQIDDDAYRRRYGYHLLFAEDGLRAIFDAMGFQDLDRAVFQAGWRE